MDGQGTEPKRHRFDALLPPPIPPSDQEFRHPAVQDVAALGRLMWSAYAGTPDEADAGGGPEGATAEIGQVFAGVHGPLLADASFVAEDGERLVAAALVTLWNGVPLLAYVFTDPRYTGRGLARRLIGAVMHALAGRGYERLSLAVTDQNVRARRLYESMGFRPAGP